mgnify:CR=1 FL=1
MANKIEYMHPRSRLTDLVFPVVGIFMCEDRMFSRISQRSNLSETEKISPFESFIEGTKDITYNAGIVLFNSIYTTGLIYLALNN